jgi:acetylornithine aminotransferase
MDLFDVYKLWQIEPVKALGCKLRDASGNEYLDMYGGHAVISIGHGHCHYKEMLKSQLDAISFYSNSVVNSLQVKLAYALGKISGYDAHSLFLSNSGAEANENALKLASFHTGKSRVLAFRKGFHGRTSGAVAVTDNPVISSPFNTNHQVDFSELNDIEDVKGKLATGEYCAVIIEGLQGVAGIYEPEVSFMKELRKLTKKYGVVLIIDEVQSGCGRTGKYFAHQYAGIKADIVTIAKGVGNGFPIGATLISPVFNPVKGMLGTTFGGNHLACAAALAVIDVIRDEKLMENALEIGRYLIYALEKIIERVGTDPVKEIRGKGLMIGVEMSEDYAPVRDLLLRDYRIFTGVARGNVIRLLPPLSLSTGEADIFLSAFESAIVKQREILKK